MGAHLVHEPTNLLQLRAVEDVVNGDNVIHHSANLLFVEVADSLHLFVDRLFVEVIGPKQIFHFHPRDLQIGFRLDPTLL